MCFFHAFNLCYAKEYFHTLSTDGLKLLSLLWQRVGFLVEKPVDVYIVVILREIFSACDQNFSAPNSNNCLALNVTIA